MKNLFLIFAFMVMIFTVRADAHHQPVNRPTICTQACQPSLGTCTIICN